MPKAIPDKGIVGVEALREAATTEYGQIADLVRAALDAVINANPQSDGRRYFDLEALFPDRVIVELDGRYWSYPYTLGADNQVSFGAREEVIETYAPVGSAMREARNTPEGHFLEARGDGTGLVWDAVLVKSGESANGRYYPDTVLREAAPLFDGRPVFAKGDQEHLKGEGKDVRNIIGYVTNTRFVEGASPDTGYLAGTVTLLAAASTLPETIREAWSRGKHDLVGLSIDATGVARTQVKDGKKLKVAQSIRRVDSVDLIVDPGAGGGLVRMLEAADPNYQQEDHDMGLKERMLEAIRAKNPAKAAAIDLATITDDALETAYREAVAPAQSQQEVGVTLEDLRMVEARANARVTITASTLPQPAKDKLLADFAARERFIEADVTGAITAERTYLARFAESGQVRMPHIDVSITEPRHVKVAQMLDAFFDPNHRDHRYVTSFRECYGEITGDRRVTGRLDDCDLTRMREALGDETNFRESLNSGSFGNVLGNSITRRLVADYRDIGQYDVWRQVASVVPVNDFRSNERTRYGGYGDLPGVAEGGPYAALTSPGDEKASYAITKRGGVEDITIEMIRNDDVGAIRRIPIKISRAAKRTLAKFVLDFLRSNPAIYDGLALFHATHGNLGATALDATQLAAARLAMLKQTEMGTSDRLGIGPRNLVVPLDLAEAATNLFNRNTNLDKNYVQSMALNVIPVWYWADTNDWCLTADPNDIPTIEIGFLDGAEEPELFVQDLPNAGSIFTNDKLTYKVRHIYGGNVLDYRGLWKAVVP